MAKRPPSDRARTDLLPRKQPTQKRARERVERILDTTAGLLDEVGVEAVTTNLIAERAGVKVASLYQYFPNKYAVLTALARRLTDRQNAVLERFLDPSSDGLAAGEIVEQMVDAFVAGSRAERGLRPMMHAMRAIPELHEVYARSNLAAADYLVALLKRRGVAGGARRLRTIAMAIVETSNAMLDLSFSDGATSGRPVVEELKKMLRGYISLYA